MTENKLPKVYEPAEVEGRWYGYWEENGFFTASTDDDRPTYSLVIPPPNVTGILHMGHALNNTLQDILVRYQRMNGRNVLWVPGTDHAGIATQNVVERQLAAEGSSRDELGREKFIERVWKWREQSGGTILKQLRTLGSSCDWTRERFTFDEGLSKAVREVFVRLYEEDLIYRGERLINWCPRCRTALSDIESPPAEEPGSLWYIKYPAADGAGALVVATTRPETMLGDTAVAVNPDDERFKSMIGKMVKLPLTDREIPVIADEGVDLEFGTGALKITPAHDHHDFEIGEKHRLPVINIFTPGGAINENGGSYEGLDRVEARKKIEKDLTEIGLLEKKEDYKINIPRCYRCTTVVEPYLSKQWFVRARPLAEPAIEAVESGRTRFVPENWSKTYYEWMNNIRDWCISRQIWWGHRIPAWYCDSCGELVVARDDPTNCPKCDAELRQDEDVLDTWFSSALWPFSTMGWPDKTKELELFYPTSVLVTAFDIIFFWVARMMMMGIKFMGEPPFAEVYIHALVRDADGRKMSKSTGNVIDPVEICESHGADAFRFTLAALAAQGRDIRLDTARIEGYRRFCNKLWNAARFSLPYLEEAPAKPDAADLSAADRFILSRLGEVTASTRRSIEEYRFDSAASGLYQFVWHEFCDWYIELAKTALNAEGKASDAARWTLSTVLDATLRLLHPFMPFITEEIRHKLPGVEGSIMVADFPVAEDFPRDPDAEEEIETVKSVIVALRNLRSEAKIEPGRAINANWLPDNEKARRIMERGLAYLLADRESKIAEFTEIDRAGADRHVDEGAATAVAGALTIIVPFAGNIDLEEELKRLDRELAKIEKDISACSGKLSNEKFVAKAPAEVVGKEREKLAALEAARATLVASRDKLKS